MEASSLMSEGITLMLFGMGFVFVFLTLLVIVTSLMSKIIIKYEKSAGVLPEDGVPAPTTFIPHHETMAPPQSGADDKSLITVLSAAVHKYRSHHK